MIEVRAAPPEHYDWIASRAQLIVSPNFRAIEAVDANGNILGMVGYDGWTSTACYMHMAVDKPIATRRLVPRAFEIPFLRLGKKMVWGTVLSTNTRALEIDRKLGFRELCFIKDGWAEGVGIHLLEMRREECRWIRGA